MCTFSLLNNYPGILRDSVSEQMTLSDTNKNRGELLAQSLNWHMPCFDNLLMSLGINIEQYSFYPMRDTAVHIPGYPNYEYKW